MTPYSRSFQLQSSIRTQQQGPFASKSASIVSLPGFACAETPKTQGPHGAGRFFKFPLVANLYSTPNFIGHKSAFRPVQSKLKFMPADDTRPSVKMREKKTATPSLVSSSFAIAHPPIPFQATSILLHVR
jgi:hypothetical protein